MCPSQVLWLGAAGPDPHWGCPVNTACFSCSLKALFPTGGPIRGCMKGLKALGKYVDLKRMNTVGVSYGCTSDLLVSAVLQQLGVESSRENSIRP